ncbi:MAG: hypothetical protein ACLT5H_09480 [Collinsella stercoris]|uniref:hypothetical protein n=1 Tax=Collinsella stercoris TaxID=147206 RepID=UPI003994C8AF
MVKLVKNFRSHAEVLEYVARLRRRTGRHHAQLLNLLPHDGRADGLRVAGASRRQALLVAGGTTEERTAAKAEAIAKRFRALADAGQPAGDMVLLLGGMTRAGVYADAIRAQGIDCVISGGSVFASTEEAKTIRALVHMLGNLADTAQGLAPVLASPLFALGVQEFLALATAWDVQTGETRRRNIELGILFDDAAPGFGDLPLLARARTVLRRAPFAPGEGSARFDRARRGQRVRLDGPSRRARGGGSRAANVLGPSTRSRRPRRNWAMHRVRVALAYDRFRRVSRRREPSTRRAAMRSAS